MNKGLFAGSPHLLNRWGRAARALSCCGTGMRLSILRGGRGDPGAFGHVKRHSTLALALLRLLTFWKSDTSAPSRWDRQDSGHMTATLPICRLDPRQFEHRTRRLQSGGLRGAFLPGFRKTRLRSADCDAYWPGVLCS